MLFSQNLFPVLVLVFLYLNKTNFFCFKKNIAVFGLRKNRLFYFLVITNTCSVFTFHCPIMKFDTSGISVSLFLFVLYSWWWFIINNNLVYQIEISLLHICFLSGRSNLTCLRSLCSQVTVLWPILQSSDTEAWPYFPAPVILGWKLTITPAHQRQYLAIYSESGEHRERCSNGIGSC